MPELSAMVTAPLVRIEDAIERAIGSASFPPILADACRYAALGSGKRLRPLLLVHAWAAAGGDEQAIEACLPAAAAIELVHAFSLVHDDLPALDNDDLRRGRPTLHIATSEPMAILAGDAMLCLPFEVLARDDDPARSVALIRELATATNAMIVGQVHDTLGGFAEGQSDARSDAQRLETVHRNKTGALIRAACRMGAIAANADAPSLATLTAFGEHYGLLFQIVDDLLDVEQTTEHLGKRAGKDADAGKLTFPGVHGTDRSRAMVAELLAQCLAALDQLPDPGRATPLRELAQHAAHRTR